ncbi:MAG: histidine kinase [Planctomycetes bacterium]|nr:histidine kinase [Planctomycetota bacterium]
MAESKTTGRTPEHIPDYVSGGHDWRLGRFPNLMLRRVEEILLVSSAYDSFILEEDGLLTELISSEYVDLGLTHAPTVTRVSSGEEALAAIRSGRFDLVITMLRLGDMDIAKFGQAVREVAPELPVVLLVATDWELAPFAEAGVRLNVASTYVWHGDAKVFLAIIKVLEDRWNAEHDARVGGVGMIILVEDSVRFRSSLLPIMYTELVKQTRAVMADGINRMHKMLRMRARPKILVAETYEQGLEYYRRFRKHLFGVIADVRFPRGGQQDPHAGLDFIREVKADNPDVPALLQSSEPGNRALAESIGVQFLHKRSSTLLQDVRDFMMHNFGFGDFVFRMPDSREVARVADLRAMARVLRDVPAESLEYHARRNHFSNWLRARTEFELAGRLRPRKVTEFGDLEELRRYLIQVFRDALWQNRCGVVEDFARQRFEPGTRFARIGGGSLGGKARGLAFVDALLARHRVDQAFEDVRVYVPQSVVIGTDVFDAFLELNRLRMLALRTTNDEWIKWAFQTADLPERVVVDLRAYLETVRGPLAVRSSSLLEDSQYYPFAGIYLTQMLRNNHPDERKRLQELQDAIKLVYASIFFSASRRYLEATPHRIEEEKMAVILQPVVGRQRGDHFYPSFAGAARSYNYYPFGHMKPEEGVASVALGLGMTVVEGGEALRFCPTHPQVLPQLADGAKFINQSQRGFYAIDLSPAKQRTPADAERSTVRLDLDVAEEHGTLAPVGSVWSNENNAFYDGIYRAGVRVVTFAHILKSDLFPLAGILRRLLELGRAGMNGPVEIEFAANLDTDPHEFAVLQMRPCAGACVRECVDVGRLPQETLLCHSPQALGNGVVDTIRDVIYVKPERFDTARTLTIANEVGELNDALQAEHRHCVLIGPGRWGSTNKWLGIPVQWSQISTARVIVETTLEDFAPDPSQGSHFFHNLTCFGIAYLTVNPQTGQGFIDWAWLQQQPVARETEFVCHVHLAEPLEARLDGRTSVAAVLKRATRSRAE